MSKQKSKDVKEKDKIRKRKERKDRKVSMNDKDRENEREQEKLRKRKQREAKKEKMKQQEEKLISPEVSKLNSRITNMKWRHYNKHKTLKIQVETLTKKALSKKAEAEKCEEQCEDVEIDSEKEEEQRESTPKKSAAKAIWDVLTPNTKKKAKLSLRQLESQTLPGPSIHQMIRDEVGINLSNNFSESSTKSKLCVAIENFFSEDHITKLCPDKKKCVVRPGTFERVQVRYRMGSLRCLHQSFCAENSEFSNCSFATFAKYVPFDVQKPRDQDWGTCLCMYCLNPQLKVHKLIQLKYIENVDVEMLDSDDFDPLIEKIDGLKQREGEKDIEYCEWRKIENPKINKSGKKGNKISRKVVDNNSFGTFIKLLVAELKVLQSHLYRAHMQYKAFKRARIEACSINESNATVHIDWSENSRIRQAGEEKSGYYYEDQVSIHAMRLWEANGETSVVSISDDTRHGAEAVIASITPILNKIVAKNTKFINIISDSPLSQYRNKKVFWFMQTFSVEHEVMIRWIYLESGHGKGVPDGIGAAAKNAIQEVVLSNPDAPIYDVAALLQNGLQDALPSIEIYVHTTEMINNIDEKIPRKLFPAPQTMMIHEVNANLPSGSLTYKLTSDQVEFFFLCIKQTRRK